MAILIDGGDRLLPDEARDQRARARAIADEVIAPIAADIDRDRHIPSAIRRQLAEAGFYGLNIPPEWGGKGSTLLAAVTIEELSRVSAAVGLSVAVQVLGSTPFILGGNREQADHWLPDLAAGRRFCSFAMTEPGSGTDAASVATMLTETGDGFQLNGEKHFISGATLSDVYTVIARSGAGRNEMTAVVVPADTPGFVIGPVQPFTGMRGMPVGRLQFIDAPVPADAQLGQRGRGFPLALATLDRARPGIAAQALGIAQGAFDAAVAYTGRRVQFGKPLLEQPVIQHRLARHAAAIAAARQLCYHAAQLIDLGAPEMSAAVSMAKLVCSDLAMQIVVDALQFWGGQGYLEGSPTERMFRDAKVTQIYEGTNEIQELVIARTILKAWGNEQPTGTDPSAG